MNLSSHHRFPQARIAEWTKTVMTSVGYLPQENEPFTTSYLRYQMAPFACNLKVDECLDSAWTQFRELIDEGKPYVSVKEPLYLTIFL